MPEIEMKVNGIAVGAQAEARTLLVDYLREELGLTGTHVGCDTSQCGACLVHVDGVLVKSCSMFALEAQGKSVTTIEGMSAQDGSLSPLQQAFRDAHGLQCGFCTPGMVMSAASLLSQTPQPSIQQIRDHLEGNLCRCTGYHNIIRAILIASGQSAEALMREEGWCDV